MMACIPFQAERVSVRAPPFRQNGLTWPENAFKELRAERPKRDLAPLPYQRAFIGL